MLVFGAEAARAGILDPIVEEQAPPVVGKTLEEVTATADEIVADATAVVEDTVLQAPATIEEVAAPVAAIVPQTPADELVSEVKGVVGGAKPVVAKTARAEEAPATATRADTPEAGMTASPATQASTVSPSQATSAAVTTPSAAPGAGPVRDPRQGTRPMSPSRQLEKPTRTRTTFISSESLTVPTSAPRDDSPARGQPSPVLPFAPLLPGNSATTEAVVAGAAGGALTVALLCAFVLLAPRTGRLSRPGPNLVRAEPCLSLPERPG